MKICLLLALFSFSIFAQSKISYSNHQEALETAKELEAQYLELVKTNPEIELSSIHLEGKYLDQYIESILIYLNEKNIPVNSIFVTKDDFTRQHSEFIDYIDQKTTPEEKSFLVQRENNAQGFKFQLKQRFKNISNQFFGTPNGISFWKFFKKNGKRVFPAKVNGKLTSSEIKQRWLTTHTIGSAALAMSISQAMKHNLINPIVEGIKSADWTLVTASLQGLATWETLAPVLAVSAYVAPLGYFTRELSGFKNQGRTVRYLGKAGKKVNVVKNKLFYYLSTIGVSMIGNAAVLTAIHGSNISASIAANGMLNSFIGNFAKIPFEFALDKIFQKAIKEEKAGNFKLAEKIHKRGTRLKTLWSWIYAGIKTIHLLAPELIVARPDYAIFITSVWAGFNAIGAISLFRDMYQYRKTIFNNISKTISSYTYSHWKHCEKAYLSDKTFFKFRKKAKADN